MESQDLICGGCGKKLGATLLSPRGNAARPSLVVCDDCISELGIGNAAARYSGVVRPGSNGVTRPSEARD